MMAMRPYTLRSSFASRKSVCAVPSPREYPATGVPSMYPTRKCAASCFAMRWRYSGLTRAKRSMATFNKPGAVEPTASVASEMPPIRYEPKAPQSPGSVAPTTSARNDVDRVTATMKLKSLVSEGRPMVVASLMPICENSPGNTLRL